MSNTTTSIYPSLSINLPLNKSNFFFLFGSSLCMCLFDIELQKSLSLYLSPYFLFIYCASKLPSDLSLYLTVRSGLHSLSIIRYFLISCTHSLSHSLTLSSFSCLPVKWPETSLKAAAAAAGVASGHALYPFLPIVRNAKVTSVTIPLSLSPPV